MVQPSPSDDAGLVEFLSARARGASDGRLAVDVGVGIVVAVVVLIWRPPAWLLVGCLGLCFAAFGGWGITDRELHDPGGRSARSSRLLRFGRALSAVIGAIAATTALILLLGAALGTWIS